MLLVLKFLHSDIILIKNKRIFILEKLILVL